MSKGNRKRSRKGKKKRSKGKRMFEIDNKSTWIFLLCPRNTTRPTFGYSSPMRASDSLIANKSQLVMQIKHRASGKSMWMMNPDKEFPMFMKTLCVAGSNRSEDE